MGVDEVSEAKGPGGRPSKYNEEVQAAAEDYVNNYQEYGDVVPTVAALALHLGVVIKTLYNWANEDNPEFLHIFNRLELLQHKSLVNGGLAGGFNPAVTKMMLTKHGYSDKQELAHTSPDGSFGAAPTKIEIVAPCMVKDDHAKD